jgi:hypothetical protein
MFAIILFGLFSPIAFLWDFLLTAWYLLRTRRFDRIFNDIVINEEDMEENMEENDEEGSEVQISVAIFDEKAYWVVDNTFYVAEIIDGEIDRSSSRPIDPFSMSNSDVKKMLFILDNLVEG